MDSVKLSEKLYSKMRTVQVLAVVLVPIVVMIIGAAATRVWAEILEFDEAEVFFEFNSTDLDLGFDIFLDGEPWETVTVTGPPPESPVFDVMTDGTLSELGNTEIMTESAEPPFCENPDECTPEEIADAIKAFQDKFPEGEYTFSGTTVEGDPIEGSAVLRHDLPAPPDIRRPREGTRLKKIKVIRWRDASEGDDPEIIGYEVVAEAVIDGETYVNTATLPGNARRFTISREFLKLVQRAHKRGTLEEFKAEVIARADNLNKTITEVVVFETEEE